VPVIAYNTPLIYMGYRDWVRFPITVL